MANLRNGLFKGALGLGLLLTAFSRDSPTPSKDPVVCRFNRYIFEHKSHQLYILEKQLLWEYALGYKGVPKALDTWDSIFHDAKAHVRTQRRAGESYQSYLVSACATIDSILVDKKFEHEGYCMISSSFRSRKLDCTGRAFIYHSVGQELGLPITFAEAPEHLIVRWLLPDTMTFLGKPYVNWEATRTQKDKRRRDGMYRDWLKISPEADSKNLYLRTFSKEESRNFLYKKMYNLVEGTIRPLDNASEMVPMMTDDSIMAARLNDFIKSNSLANASRLREYLCRKALKYDSLSIPAIINLGREKCLQGSLDEWMDYNRKALSIDKSHPIANLNMGYSFYSMNRADSGLLYVREAVRLDSRLDEDWSDYARANTKKDTTQIVRMKDYIQYHPEDSVAIKMYEDTMRVVKK